MLEECPSPKDWPSEVTWWLFKEDEGFDDRYDKAGDSLEKMFERYEIYPVKIDDAPVFYLARFEFPKYDEDLQFPEAILSKDDMAGFVDFLSGWPMENIEMLVMVGELSSKKDKEDGHLEVHKGEREDATAPLPDDFFEGYDDKKVPVNWIYLDAKFADSMVDGLGGEPEPEGLHWWVRVNLKQKDTKYPVPGEFFALAVRLMPNRMWGEQKSSPFLFSGNWMDTVFYTSGIINEIEEPTDERPYPLYKVQWRGEEVEVKPSDFAEYQVGDRVAIIKDITAEKKSQLWKDEDMDTFDGEKWMIAPINFYGLKEQDEED